MARSRRRRTRKGEGNFLNVSGILLIVVIVAASFYILNKNRDIRTDARGCPLETGYTKNSISFLLDTTQEITATQKNEIKNAFFKIASAADDFDLIKIYQVDPSAKELLKEDFNLCKPTKNTYGDPIFALFSSVRFEQHMETLFKEAAFARPKSPIIEAIGSIETQFPDDGSQRHLIIASDLIEFSDILNQFKPEWEKEADKVNQLLLSKQPNLKGVQISILWIPRNYSHHNDDFLKWWINYLEKANGTVTGQSFYNSRTKESYNISMVIKITG